MKTLMKALSTAALGALLLASCGGTDPNLYRIWTQEGEADGALQFVTALADEFAAQYNEANGTNIRFAVENRETEVLREDFITASKAGNAPEMVWTVNDHIGPFQAADIIMPIDGVAGLDPARFVNSAIVAAKLGEKTWGVPVSNGNHLMLLYNKDLVQTPPRTTDELIALGKQLTQGSNYGLVFNQTEPFWLVPWLGGFGGKVFADDGVTPTLNTPAMVNTLQFLRDLKFVHGILPPESDYGASDTLFKEGKAAMLINGDWAMGDYIAAMGDKLGVTRIPLVTSTGLWPAPYTSGKFLLFSKIHGADEDRLNIMVQFANFVTNNANQSRMVQYLTRLPSTIEAVSQERLVDNEVANQILKDSAYQLEVGTPMPTVLEMRFNWDSMRPQMAAVMTDRASPAEAARVMQENAEKLNAANKQQ